MSGNSNTTIARPGPHWGGLQWNFGLDNFQLDLVGFLAILGEGSVLANAQVSALSRLFYLPRLIPAPQALLLPNRPATLPPTPACVTGVVSGNVKDHIHHVANILLKGDEMPKFMVRCVKVVKKTSHHQTTWVDTFLRGEPTREGEDSDIRPSLVTAKANGPLTWVTLLGSFLSVCLFIISITLGDGWSLVATLLLSFLSTLIGFVNKWNLKLPQGPRGGDPPGGDVVIRYPNGSYLIVRCEEAIARELYFAPEEIEYNIQNPAVYRIISLCGTLMLMIGVIALANSKLELQFAWAGAYIIINIAHWIAAAVPQYMHWDMSCYEITEESVAGGPDNKTFTDALWKAIIFTKSIAWVRVGKAAPQTQVWDDWLREAEQQAINCGSHVGPLQSPKWRAKDSEQGTEKGTVWNLPEEWDAKKAWDTLNRDSTAFRGVGMPQRAVA